MKLIFVVIFGLCGSIDADSKDYGSWSYDYETQWGGYCREGAKQSPINIITQDTTEDKFEAHIRGPLQFQGYKNVDLKALNNKHTLKWENTQFPHEGPILSGGPLRGNYTFVQFHLHWLSEHALNGMKYALEIHMVHLKQGLSVDEALSRADGVAVIGIMCELADEGQALEEVIKDVPYLTDRGSEVDSGRNVDLTRMLSPNPQSYYTYHGSLTTPGCQEVVTWIVMDKPTVISHDQMRLLSKVDVGTLHNSRSLQPVNRVVYRVQGNPMASCANMSTPTLITTLGALINCFSSQFIKALKKTACILYNTKKKFFNSSSNIKECLAIN